MTVVEVLIPTSSPQVSFLFRNNVEKQVVEMPLAGAERSLH